MASIRNYIYNKLEQAKPLLFSFSVKTRRITPTLIFAGSIIGYTFYGVYQYTGKEYISLDWLFRKLTDFGALPLLIIGGHFKYWNQRQWYIYLLCWLTWMLNTIYAVGELPYDLVFMIFLLLLWCIFGYNLVKSLINRNK